jgi:hypothetical protein
MFLLRLGARRQIATMLLANGPSTAKCQTSLQAPECPRGDTLTYASARSEVAEVQDAGIRYSNTGFAAFSRMLVLSKASGIVATQRARQRWFLTSRSLQLL